MKIKSIAVIGQGYVGLPLAIELAKHYPVIGFDINKKRVSELNNCKDVTLEVNKNDLNDVISLYKSSKSKYGYKASSDPKNINDVNTYIITVPTPINEFKSPNLEPLRNASYMVGKHLRKGDFIILVNSIARLYWVCIPILEKESKLKLNDGFYVGYSPEELIADDSYFK